MTPSDSKRITVYVPGQLVQVQDTAAPLGSQGKYIDLGEVLSNLYSTPYGEIRIVVTVANYTAALAEATGVRYKEIKVLVDETDSGALNNRYNYDGVPGVLDLIF